MESSGRYGAARKIFRNPVLLAFARAPSGIVGLFVVLLIIIDMIVAPIFLHDKTVKADYLHTHAHPSWAHPLGTDDLGRDLLARLLVATRLSIGLALASAGVGLGIGVTLGAATALLSPRIRPLFLRGIETMLSFPALLTAIFVSVIVGVGVLGPLFGVGIALSFSLARLTSTLALSVGGREYVNAARVLGVRGPRLMLRYILPNIAEPLIIACSVLISISIITVSALSFLGLGVQPPSFDWGRMLTDGVRSIYVTPAAALGPAAAIAIAALAFGFAGEALARAMNPLLWTTSPKKRKVGSGVVGDDDNDARADDHDVELLRTTAAGVVETNGNIVEVRDLVVTFPGPIGPIEIVKGVSFAVPAGSRIGIVGESGSGKTMTALAVAQLIPYPGRVDGTIMLEGENLLQLSQSRLNKLLGTDLAVVFQDPMSSLNPALTIGRQLTEGAEVHRGLSHGEASTLAASRLREVHIAAPEQQMKRRPHEFSGGMRQRTLIAMGLMNEPALLVADEPTTALDVTIQAQIMDLLADINQSHKTAMILISHNLALVSQNCDRVLVMYGGRIVEDLPADELLTKAQHPYTRALLGAVPDLMRMRNAPLEYIPGETPDLAAPPAGCAFHPRCPLALDRCHQERPVLLRGEDGRRVACHVANDATALSGAEPAAAARSNS
jgi:oligopeptide/dipeptide ABC transporter ATP-binding protein